MILPFILTLIAGLSTLIGVLPIFIKNINKDKIIAISCAFASGVMLCLSIFDLIPEGIKEIGVKHYSLFTITISFISILIGIITSMFLENITSKVSNNNLYNVGLLTMIALIIHNIPEGIVTYTVSNKNILLGIPLCLAIAIHNIPEGISIAIPIYYSTNKKYLAILYTFISGISEFFGAILTYLFLNKYMNNLILGIIFLFTAGIMIALSYDKLLPTGVNYHKKLSYIAFIFGIIIMLISLQLNNLIS